MLARQQGFALIEVMIAAFVLVVGVLAVMMTFADSQKLQVVSERMSTMSHVAQREIERIEGIPYASIGLNATPPTSTDRRNPDYYVNTHGSSSTFEWDRTAGSTEPLDVDTAGGVIVPVGSWSEGTLNGSLYDFVTWAGDAHCSPGCSGTQDYKRITVGVIMNGDLNPTPIFVSSVIADPSSAPAQGVVDGTAGNPITHATTTCANASGVQVQCQSPIDAGSPNTFYLHDCAANSSCTGAPSGNSLVHQTVGVVGNLLCTTSTLLGLLGADITGCPTPDLMDANPPAGTPTTPLVQYSSDLGTVLGGRVLNPTCSGTSGCGTGKASDCNGGGSWSSALAKAQSEFWVSNPLPAALTLNGEGGLSMYSQALGGVGASVSFCVEIYMVPPSGGLAGSLTNLLAWPPVALGGAGYAAVAGPTGSNWPSSASQIAYTFNYLNSGSTATIPAGDRIGVRVWMVATANLPISLLYDTPLYPSEIQLNSQ